MGNHSEPPVARTPSPDAPARLLLTSSRIYDGSGAAPFRGSVLIEDGRICEVIRGSVPETPDFTQTVDVGDRVLSPGFVDLHTHSDVSVLSQPTCISAVGQGITTQVVGHCGFSAAPVSAETVTGMVDEEPVFGFPGVDWSWSEMGEYLEAVRRHRPATNIVSLVGHNTVRRLVMRGSPRGADAQETAAMAGQIDGAMAAGAAGLSTGLSYAPGLFADEQELRAIARVAARRGLRYHTHMRYGGTPIGQALREAIDLAAASGVALNVSHLYPSPKDAPDEADRLLQAIDSARSAGVDVTFDLTVFCRGGGAWLQALPPWARAGGLAGTLACIADRRERSRLVTFLEGSQIDWDDNVIVKIAHPENAHLVGKSIGQLARERRQGPADTALQLVVEDGQFWVAPHVKRQTDLDTLITHPTCVPVTDGMAAHPIAHRALGVMPKTFGTMPLVLGSYVRARRVLRLEQAIHKLTRLAAERAGLSDRGLLAPGFAADLVVFDAERIANRADDDDPTAAPAGIDQVLINGRWAVRNGQLTQERAGKVLAAA
jgi:N-acyl-D-amino-acid deacylase